ncbi:MAG: hypothetical protein ACREH8_06745 [Opitutaceae bacterium]
MTTSSPRSSLTAAALLAAAVLVSFAASLARATGNLWYDKFVTYEAASGNAYYTSTDASLLGWQEGYMLRSYVVLYELTKNTAWLDKFTTHVDTIIANAADSDGDGYLDWKTDTQVAGQFYSYLHFDGLISLPLAQFVRLVSQNPTTLSAYATKASNYQVHIEAEVIPKWTDSSSTMGNCWVQVSSSTGYFRESTKYDSLPSGTFNPLPYNMMAPYAQMLFVTGTAWFDNVKIKQSGDAW